jgi:hypothetical protein
MKLYMALMVLLLISSACAEAEEASQAQGAVDFILSLNPVILLIAGIILFLASGLAKVIAIILILLGAASLILSII